MICSIDKSGDLKVRRTGSCGNSAEQHLRERRRCVSVSSVQRFLEQWAFCFP